MKITLSSGYSCNSAGLGRLMIDISKSIFDPDLTQTKVTDLDQMIRYRAEAMSLRLSQFMHSYTCTLRSRLIPTYLSTMTIDAQVGPQYRIPDAVK